MESFEPWLTQSSPYQTEAILLAVRITPSDMHLRWLKRLTQPLAQTPAQTLQLIVALGALGDPRHIPWLFARMEQPQFAAMAGYAFSTITGIDLTETAMTLQPSPLDDDLDTEVCPAGYEQLPLPNAELVARYWSRHSATLVPGQAYFLGQPKSQERLEAVLRQGQQGHRQAAALELALLSKGRILPNIKQVTVS